MPSAALWGWLSLPGKDSDGTEQVQRWRPARPQRHAVLVWLRSGPFHQQIWVAPEAARHGEVTIKARQPQAATGRYATSRAVNPRLLPGSIGCGGVTSSAMRSVSAAAWGRRSAPRSRTCRRAQDGDTILSGVFADQAALYGGARAAGVAGVGADRSPSPAAGLTIAPVGGGLTT